MPRFSVVLPVYDRQEAARRAVDSVLSQSFEDFELIIVDDGSPDAFRLTDAYRRDGRIRLIRQDQNRGPGAARNAGAATAKGEWIAWIDSDDCWHPEKLRLQAERIAKIPVDAMTAVATGFRYCGSTHRENSRIPIPAAEPHLFFAGCWFCPGTTTVVSHETFSRVGRYDERLRRFEDVDWFIRFGRAGGRLYVVDQVLADISWHPPPLSAISPAAQTLISKMERLAGPAELRQLKAFLRLALAASAWEEGRPLVFAAELARSLALQPRLRLQLFNFWSSAPNTATGPASAEDRQDAEDTRRTSLRVCVWYWGRRGGGLRLTRELVMALSAHHRLSLSLSSYCEEVPKNCGQFPVHMVPTYRDSREFTLSMVRLPGALRSFRKFLESTQPELVLTPMLAPWQALLLPFLGRWQQKTVVLIHDPEPHPGADTAAIDWLSARIAVRFAGRIVALTENSAERIRRVAPPWRRIDVVPMGIPAEAAGSCVSRPFPTGRPFRFLFFGRLEKYKGLGILSDAVRLLENAGDWEIQIIGDGPASKEMRKALGSHPRARLRLGWVPESEVDRIVGAADCLVCPYTEASQSGVVVQAIGAAVPSIVTPVGALPEQVEFGRLGLIAEAVSAQALSNAMTAMMADPARYEALSKATAEAARERYAWPTLIDRLLSG